MLDCKFKTIFKATFIQINMQCFSRYRNIRIIFVVGIPTKSPEDIEHPNHEVQIKIEEEFAQFGDILQVNQLKKLHK